MRMLALLIVAAVANLPAAGTAQEQSPRDTLQSLGFAPSGKKVRKAVAKAERHPLGSKDNPVRAEGPAGQRAYIARLRCSDGNSPTIGTRGSVGVGPFGTIVDRFPLDCGAAAPGKADLFMDMYHDGHEEDRAPDGFIIAPR